MFFDLNVPIPSTSSVASSKKGKGKQPQNASSPQFSAAQLNAIDAHLDLLVHLGYTVIAFNQTVHKKVDPKIHVNVLDGLLAQLKKRNGIVFLKRLSIILDEDSEKGFGLINAHTAYFNSYDLLSLIPTNQATFALACLTHTLPSPLTTHIISLPLTLPRLPFHLKHTLVRTAIKNGAVFEINYVGGLGGESEAVLLDAGAAESNGGSAKRNWWAAARELVRVTKGKGLLVSGGVVAQADLRAPRDVANLITLLGLPQDGAHHASTSTPKSVVLRAQTRKTFKAVFSEPQLIVPAGYEERPQPAVSDVASAAAPVPASATALATTTSSTTQSASTPAMKQSISFQKKRPREDNDEQGQNQEDRGPTTTDARQAKVQDAHDGAKKKKRKKNNKE